jgi:hypothetical protein
MRRLAAVLTLAGALSCGCGYHVSGHADLLPKSIKTIAIPAFANLTTRHRLAQQLPAALTREFITRTRYQVVADPNLADAVLGGVVVNYASYPTVLDPTTGRASSIQLNVVMQVTLTERATGAVLFSRPNLVVRERYEISVDPSAYLEESDAALERASRQVARAVVSAILESF